jgi:alpha-1,3-rhamnosyltransferase
MEDSQPDVFAVVPSYNHGGFIEKCIRSIFRQTVAPKKLLVIDDGSTDGSPEIIAATLKDCPFDSELIVRENRGLCATLNQAYSLSSGKYFAYLGADDLWLPKFFEERIKLMESRPDAILGYGHAYFVDENDMILDSSADFAPAKELYAGGHARELLLNAMAPISSTVFYRRSALADVRWNEESRLEDYEMYIKLVNLGEFAFDPQVLSVWRYHSNNTSKDFEMMLAEVLETQKRRMSELKVGGTEFETMQDRTRFSYARIMLQHGDKAGAFRLAGSARRGASSTSEMLKFYIRLAVPMAVVNLKRKLSKPTQRHELVLD